MLPYVRMQSADKANGLPGCSSPSLIRWTLALAPVGLNRPRHAAFAY